jgi:predicted nucleic acid-binding Zn ribbon protein
MSVIGDPGFASEAYRRAQKIWKGVTSRGRTHSRSPADPSQIPFTPGRDPKPLGDVLAFTTEDMGWSSELEEAKVISDWDRLVGETIAPHTSVIELRDHHLIVQCDSTAWATELRRMRAVILSRIIEQYPQAEIEDLRFLAPGAPSWRHGARVVRGRGPRDTYG